MKEYNPEDVIRMTEVLNNFHNEISNFVQSHSIDPFENSLASKEQASPTYYLEQVHTLQGQVDTFIEVAADHFAAFIKTITPPPETIAPWTCVRSILEAVALGIWLLDPEADVIQRIQRSLSIQLKEIKQQIIIHKLLQQDNTVNELENKIVGLEKEAIQAGIKPLKNEKHKIIGFGQVMPNFTELIKITLNEELTYRCLSSITHGNCLELYNSSFSQLPEHDEIIKGVQLRGMKKSINIDGIVFLIIKAFQLFAKLIWYKSLYYGWDCSRLGKIIDNTYIQLGFKPKIRFWD